MLAQDALRTVIWQGERFRVVRVPEESGRGWVTPPHFEVEIRWFDTRANRYFAWERTDFMEGNDQEDFVNEIGTVLTGAASVLAHE